MHKAEQIDNPQILIVDADPNELKMLLIGLELEGFKATGTSSSAEALELLETKRFDAALIDLMMPEVNGLQLARTFRTARPQVTTILMSAYHLSPVQLARANTGAVGFVPKPFLFDDLVAFIHSKTTGRPSGPPIEADPSRRSADGLHTPFDVPDAV